VRRLVGKSNHFAGISTKFNFGLGVAVLSLKVTSPTTADVTLKVDAKAMPGPRSVTAITSTEVARIGNGLSVTTSGVYRISVSRFDVVHKATDDQNDIVGYNTYGMGNEVYLAAYSHIVDRRTMAIRTSNLV
jgi:hypothetical protein